MDIRNCKMCGRLYNHISGMRVCPDCANKLEEKFQQVKEYIRENKQASLTMIAEENDVSIPQIKQWIREERLVFTEDSIVGIECENCGTMIRTGRFCKKCKDEMASNMTQAFKTPEPVIEAKKSIKDKNKDQMRYFNK